MMENTDTGNEKILPPLPNEDRDFFLDLIDNPQELNEAPINYQSQLNTNRTATPNPGRNGHVNVSPSRKSCTEPSALQADTVRVAGSISQTT